MTYLLIATIFKMTLTGSIAILLIFLARKLLGRSPKIFSYVLWFFALFRLLCPISFETPIAIIPEGVSTGQLVMQLTSEESRGSLEEYGKDFTGFYMQPETEVNINMMQILFLVWLIGFVIVITRSVLSLRRLQQQTACCMLLEDNIYLADYIDSPFVIGLIKPKIYVPSSISEVELKYVLAHEKHHIKRKDHIVKFIGFIALSMHWFNPAVWYMFETMCMDMEMSCDEAVLKRMGDDTREDYSSILLTLSGKSRFVSSIPLAFVEGDTKTRIQNILKWKKPTMIFVTVASIICLCSGLLTLANPVIPDRTVVKTYEQSQDICRPKEGSTMDIWWHEDFRNSFKDTYSTERKLVLDTYHQLADGTWKSAQYYYKYLLELSGEVNHRPITLYVLSNVDNITFEEACWSCRWDLGEEYIEMPKTLIGKNNFRTHTWGFALGMHTLVGVKYAE